MNDQLGRTPDSGACRDAIHIAIYPAVAGERLKPGQHVGFKDGKAVASDPVGIVDPFLKTPLGAGQSFWLLLYPNTITTLRHEWTHPLFREDGSVKGSESEEWIREFGARVGVRYEELISTAAEYVRDREYINHGSALEGEYVPDEFWPHYEVVTGTKVQDKDRGSFFTCSC